MPSRSTSSATAGAAAARPVQTEGPLTFQRVAELDYPIEFAPLGKHAFLLAGDSQRIALLIEGSVVRFLPELALLDAATDPGYLLSAIGGSWPDDAWMALSHSSDAGPASADVYQFSVDQRSWQKKHEHPTGVAALQRWRGNLVLVGALFSVPVAMNHPIHELSTQGIASLGYGGCSSGSLLAPVWIRDGALNLVGQPCAPTDGTVAAAGDALIIDSWSLAGDRTQQRLPLGDQQSVDRVVTDAEGLAALMLRDHSPRLARFVAGRWVSAGDLPRDYRAVLSSPGHALWLLGDGAVLGWQGRDWQRIRLPQVEGAAAVAWLSVWARGAGDVWLIGHDQGRGKYSLWSTLNGARAQTLPTATERDALGQAMTHEAEDCPRPFVNFIVQAPPQLDENVP